MKKLTFIDYPKFVPRAEYDKAIDFMVQKMKNIPGVISICQVGGINDPGISDIDLVVIFEKGSKLFEDPRSGLKKKMKYLFSHNLFGMPVDYLFRVKEFSFFNSFRSVWGEKIDFSSSLNLRNNEQLRSQIAIEYLIKFYITLSVQLTYRVVKLRPILLEARALELDLEILGKEGHRLGAEVRAVLLMRKNWFKSRPGHKTLRKWILILYSELELFIRELFENIGYKYYLGGNGERFKSSQNVIMTASNDFKFEHNGRVLPGGIFVRLGGKRYFNLNHRFNNFEFFLPIVNFKGKKILEERDVVNSACLEYNRMYLPHFSPLISGVSVKKFE